MEPEIDVKSGVADRPALPDWGAHHVVVVEPAALPRRNDEARTGVPPQATIRVANRYGASAADAFDAWLDPTVAGRWLFATASQPMAHVEIDGRVGGSFCFVEQLQAGRIIRYTGQYSEIVRDRRLAFTLSMEPHPDVVTRVAVAIAPRAKGCMLELTHENIPRAHASYVEGRWTGILYGLGVTLDSVSAMFHLEQE
jgi:uncharacterized protein YndB with AHSA1/START domain